MKSNTRTVPSTEEVASLQSVGENLTENMINFITVISRLHVINSSMLPYVAKYSKCFSINKTCNTRERVYSRGGPDGVVVGLKSVYIVEV